MENNQDYTRSHTDFDTTTKIEPDYQDDVEIPPEDLKFLEMFDYLKEFAVNINNIIRSPKKNAATKIKLIKEATQVIDFSDLQELAALQEQQPVDPQEDFENEESIEKLKQERVDCKKRIEELQAQLEKNVHGEIPLLNSLDEELHRLGDRKSSFEEQEKELLRLHQQEIDSFKARIAEADQMNEELIKKKTDLEAQIESCKQGASKHEEYQAERGKNQRLDAELKEKVEIIHTQKKALQELNEQGKRLNMKIHDLEADRQGLRQRNTKLIEEHGQHEVVLQEQMNKLKIQLAEKEKALSQIYLQLQSKIEQIQAKAAQISSYAAKVQTQTHQISLSKHEKTKLQSQVKQLHEARRQLEYKYSSLNQQFIQIQSQKQTQQKELAQLKEFKSAHEQSIAKYQHQIAVLKRQLNALKSEVSLQSTQKRICEQIRHHFNHLQKQSKEQFKRNIAITVGSLK